MGRELEVNERFTFEGEHKDDRMDVGISDYEANLLPSAYGWTMFGIVLTLMLVILAMILDLI